MRTVNVSTIQEASTDIQVVAAVWSNVQQLLMCEHAATGQAIGLWTKMLPSLRSIPVQDLQGIARLHLQSAAHHKASMKLIAPDAFAAGETEPNLAALVDDSHPTAAEMVAKLIDLQIFHLARVREIVAHMRMHTAKQRSALAAACAPAAPREDDVSSINSSGGVPEMGRAEMEL